MKNLLSWLAFGGKQPKTTIIVRERTSINVDAVGENNWRLQYGSGMKKQSQLMKLRAAVRRAI